MFSTFTLPHSQIIMQCPVRLLYLLPLCRTFQLRCSGIFLIFLRWFQFWNVAHVLSEWFWKNSNRPYYYRYNFAFIFHTRWISIMRFLYFKTFSAPYLITFLSPRIATSINMYVSFQLSRIMVSGLDIAKVSVK